MKCQHEYDEDRQMGELLLKKYLDVSSQIRSFSKILSLAACHESGLVLSDCADIYDAIFEDFLPEIEDEDDDSDATR